jgi:hypothetical protein
MSLRVGGHYNHVIENHGPYIGRDARLAITVDRTLNGKSAELTAAAGLIIFSATNNMHDPDNGARAENRHYFSPVVAVMQTVAHRISLGLELTFGAITDFRWRTEIQL